MVRLFYRGGVFPASLFIPLIFPSRQEFRIRRRNISYNGFPDLNTGGFSMFEGLFSNMNLILDVIVSILQIMVFGLLFLLIFDSIYDSIHKRHIKVRETAAAKAVADAAGPAAE